MRALILLFICLMSAGIAWTQELPSDFYKILVPKKEEVNINQDEYFQQLIEGVNQFGFDLYQQLKSRQGNLLFSPYSIATGISMVGMGTRGGTSLEIQKALHYSLNLSPLIHDLNQYLAANAAATRYSFLSVAASIWLQETIPLLPSFQISLKRNFDFILQPVNFENSSQTLTAINKWMSQSTYGKINQILSSQEINPAIQLILTTGFYWKGEWETPFDRQETVKTPFAYRGHPLQVEMMKQRSAFLTLFEEHFEMIEIAFRKAPDIQAQLVMVLLLPKEGTELAQLEKEFNAAQWKKWTQQLKSRSVEIHLPKFRAVGSFDLHPVLKSLGINKAFDPSADFSSISEKRKVYLNQAVHKTQMRIDESGSDGSMVIAARRKQMVEEIETIKIDRPFFFVIQDKETGLILSIGRIVQP
ncbi:MAG: serpin family protein [Chlamydiales bacterium]